MILSDNQKRYLQRFPHMTDLVHTLDWAAQKAERVGSGQQHIPLAAYDACPHRGPFIDLKSCGCTAWECKIHTKCTTTRRAAQRFSLQLCQECSVFQPAQ